jgi:hypothetical protein
MILSTGELEGGFSLNVGSRFSKLRTTKEKKQILFSQFKVMAPIYFHVNEKKNNPNNTSLDVLAEADLIRGCAAVESPHAKIKVKGRTFSLKYYMQLALFIFLSSWASDIKALNRRLLTTLLRLKFEP